MSVPLSPINSAFQSWKAAHDQLGNSITAYVTACTHLHYTLSFARPSYHDGHDFFDAGLLEIDNKLPECEGYKQILDDGVHNLQKARNLSFSLASINILPQPLLLRIFAMVIDSESIKETALPLPRQMQRHPMLTLSSVCTSWRNLALESPSFWSTIVFHREDRESQLARLSLTRAGDAPLDVYVTLPPDSQYDWLSILSPKRDQIRTLDIVLQKVSSLPLVLALWPRDSFAPSLRTLSVKIVRSVACHDKPTPQVLPDGVHGSFLQNLTSFSLCGGGFDWDSAAFVGLEHLQIAWATCSAPTLSQLIGMLRASPRLRTLCLTDPGFTDSEVEEYQPVYLPHLQKLSLMRIKYPFAVQRQLISLLFPGSLPLALHIEWFGLSSEPDNAEILSQLFRRSNVQSMYFYNKIARDDMFNLFSALPDLRLLLCSKSEITEILETLSHRANPNNLTPTSSLPCPQLRSLYFHKCKLNTTNWHSLGLITNQPTLIVKFQSCTPPPHFRVYLSQLASNEVLLEHSDSSMFYEAPIDGVDYDYPPATTINYMPSAFVSTLHI
ncbi:hypothetical protein FRC12_008988 [Ceratobasidium sp. 428]|nr:hypothetical protein FRC12_008988 [Ceratobasidium sp. 428]